MQQSDPEGSICSDSQDTISLQSGAYGKRQHELLLGGEWQIGRTIGRGTSGRVRIAKHARTGSFAAVKTIRKNACDNLTVQREIGLLKLVKHCNMIKLLATYETVGAYHLVSEYCSHGELYQYVCQNDLEDEQVRDWFGQLISAVEALHAIGICHRDIKLENVFLADSLEPDGTLIVKLGDLGMATFQPEGAFSTTSCGSPHYVAPEVLRGEPYDATMSDIWSCGVVLYALASYTLPFDDEHIPTLLSKIKDGQIDMHESIEGDTRDLLSQILVPDPDERLTIPGIQGHAFFDEFDWMSSARARELGEHTPQASSPDQVDSQVFEQIVAILRCSISVAGELVDNPNDPQVHEMYQRLKQNTLSIRHGVQDDPRFADDKQTFTSADLSVLNRFPETPAASSLHEIVVPSSAPAVVTTFARDTRPISPVSLDPPRSAGFSDIRQHVDPVLTDFAAPMQIRKRRSVQQRIREFFARDRPTSIFDQADEDSARHVLLHMSSRESIGSEHKAHEADEGSRVRRGGLKRSRCITALQRAVQGLTPSTLSAASSPAVQDVLPSVFDVSHLDLPPGLSSQSPEKVQRYDDNLLSPFGRLHHEQPDPDSSASNDNEGGWRLSPLADYGDSPTSPATLRQGSAPRPSSQTEFVLSTPTPKVRRRRARPGPLTLQQDYDDGHGLETPLGNQTRLATKRRHASGLQSRTELLHSPASPTEGLSRAVFDGDGLSSTSVTLVDQLIQHLRQMDSRAADLELERDMLRLRVQEQDDLICRLELRVHEPEKGENGL
ncbi:hypothetical protein ACM66B_004586 [Microbotryomycetes sp. NB124-2]